MSGVAAPAPAFTRLGTGVSAARKMKDRAFTVGLWVCGGLAMLPLLFIATYVIERGLKALSINFFLKTPGIPGQPGGGIAEAFVGTAIIVGIMAVIAVPLGLLTAVYLSEYGRGWFASTVRFVAEILLSTPSIVAGAFIWAVVVVRLGAFSGFAAALALCVLVWPIITRATEEVLRLVPQELREGALALGVPRWKVILRVVIPTAGAGIFTAIMLAMARGLGETAPVLLTALGNSFMTTNAFGPMDSLSLRVYVDAQSSYALDNVTAWAGAFCLLIIVLGLSIGARVIAARQLRRTR
ncbi:MAG TPA: phosphate ABC transporter permease PstA [Actinomycetota bacterium]|jgi:phosphate transport system permease protein|nr:phosphate ABC transporter permease PstA [Actinomycetota bacterium]